jgi:hypothetical protein
MSQAAERMYRALELITRSQNDVSEPGATLAEDYTSPANLVDALIGTVDLFNIVLLKQREATGRTIPALLQELGQTIASGEARGVI